jgi:serine/threonine-protein kinase RsbW
VELEIANDVGEIERVVELVRRECELMQFGEHQLRLNVPVALTEALSNAILYGNAENPGKRVRVHARVTHVHLVVEVTDEGAGFDLAACTVDPTTPENLEGEDHRGLFLMQKLMDSVERFAGQPGNVVRLTLHRAS